MADSSFHTRQIATSLDVSRRRFFTSAASGLGALAVASMFGESSAGQEGGDRVLHHPPRAKRCIFVFLAGGLSHVDLFDPKPELQHRAGEPLAASFFENERFSNIEPGKSLLMPARFGFRRYGQSGIEMSELLPHVGTQVDHLTLVRSMYTDEFDHAPGEIFFSTGVNVPGRPSVGSWLSYGLGTENRNLPAYVVLMTGRGPVSRSAAWGNAFLPAECGGVLFRNQGEPLLNLADPPGISRSMQERQLDAVRRLNRLRYQSIHDDQIESRIRAYELAFRMQAAAPDLIDLETETAATHRLYGTDRPGEGGSFGRNCLLARRLVEKGVRFVSIFHRRWDHHSRLRHLLPVNCSIVDRPLGALLRDLQRRGLLEDTMVVCGTEFGRTPVTENSGIADDAGRDHHRFGFSIWMAGGGCREGHVVGSTDEFGWAAAENPVHVNDFHATLLHLFGIDHHRLTQRFQGLDVRLTNLGGNVVSEITKSS